MLANLLQKLYEKTSQVPALVKILYLQIEIDAWDNREKSMLGS